MKKMEYQREQLRKIQLQTLLVNVQSFIDQFSIKKVGPVLAYIESKNSKIFPEDIKIIAKGIFAKNFI